MGWGMQKGAKKDCATLSWFTKECRPGKEEALKVLRKWKNEKARENRRVYVEITMQGNN
jgi:hypothetical protein